MSSRRQAAVKDRPSGAGRRTRVLMASGCAFVVLAGLGIPVAAQEGKRPTGETYQQILDRLGDGMLENIVIRGEHNARTDSRAKKRFYTDLSTMSDYPAYQPRQQVSGTIKVSGLYLHDGLIKDEWIKEFQRFQPGAKVVISQGGTVASGKVHIQTGPRINDRLREASEYERATGQRIFEIDWATGSYDVPGWSPGFVIFVHKDNPIAHMTVEQLDGIFAGARTGGWKGTTWDPSAARGPEKNLRTWGQLGLTGEWANQPIHIYGRPLKYNIQLGFERKVFNGGDIWNENTMEYSHEMNADGTRYTSSVEMVKDMAADKYGIVFSDMGSAIPGVRAVPIGATDAGPFVPISRESLRDRSYPLFIEQWAEARVAPGKPLDPLVKEFLTFMLSREGQDAIQRDGKWFPIPAARAREMIAKLDELGAPVDPRELGLQTEMIAPKKWDGESPDETGKVNPKQAYYKKRFDLSDLPAYTPAAQVSGSIRMPASGQLMGSTVGQALIDAFKRHQPGITFDLKDGDLNAGDVDLSMGRKWTTYFAGEFYDFQMKHERSPREIRVATGSFDVSGWSPAMAILVNRSNPIKGLTIKQLDGIFGGPRRGGWVSTTWRRQAGRSAEQNIRSWSELGIGNICASKPIDVVVPPLKYHIMSVFERKVLVGGNIWNDDAHEVPLALNPDKSRTVPNADRARMVGNDPCAITFAGAGFSNDKTRLVPIAAADGQPFVLPTLETVRNGSYPLGLEVYAYADQLPDQPLDPKLKEFLRFVLSREGQDIIQRDGKWLPLTGAMARAELKKLDAIIPQVKAPPVAPKKAAAASEGAN
ncbi:PstS family phosphate ABC transporter substrate-binding protein [Sphingomonas leidyi]|uniref:PstS family phosphate ABC transporter substrate-binding protein n=2 Tax=Sphingomonadaceae TaxID=41297 RepID=UPI0036D384E8